jgi:hypothetical protein
MKFDRWTLFCLIAISASTLAGCSIGFLLAERDGLQRRLERYESKSI